jgi:hypothetical protein
MLCFFSSSRLIESYLTLRMGCWTTLASRIVYGIIRMSSFSMSLSQHFWLWVLTQKSMLVINLWTGFLALPQRGVSIMMILSLHYIADMFAGCYSKTFRLVDCADQTQGQRASVHPLFSLTLSFLGRLPHTVPSLYFHDPNEMWSVTLVFPANRHWSGYACFGFT